MASVTDRPDQHELTDRMARIRSIRATPVNIPLEAPYRWSVGQFAGMSKTVVEVETADGVVGVGEAPNHQSARLIEEALAPKLIGANPYDFAACEHRCIPPIRVLLNTDDASVVRAYGGVEMALWDLVGKLEGRSVASLLGGRVREEVAFTEYFAFRAPANGHRYEETPADVARYCERMLAEHGARSFEGKVGVEPFEVELEMVREIRRAIGPDLPLRLDANMAWSVTTARGALRRLEEHNISSIEEPARSLEEMAQLRQSTSIAFSAHDANLKAAVRLGVPDAFVINLTALGGLRRTVSFVQACEQLGISVWFYSPDGGIANAAYLQVAAAVDWLDQPSQTLLRWHADDVIVGGPWRPKNGVLSVPHGPGLGVELDAESVRRCHQRFLDDGPYDQYADPMRGDYYVH
jgi:glucarate dehydratase